MRNIIIKITLLVLVVLSGKVPAFSQDTDIRCEISGLDLNLSQADPGYFINFGSFSLFADGEKSKEEEGVVGIVKYYKLPRTKLVLSVGMVYVPSDETSSFPQLKTMMVLSKKKVPISSDSELDKFFDINEMTKNVINTVEVLYSMRAFDGSEGIIISMPFLGKKKPVHIMMKCKKVKKEGK